MSQVVHPADRPRPDEAPRPVSTQDVLGERMRTLEAHETARRFLPGLPVYARIDGRGFTGFTRGLRRL